MPRKPHKSDLPQKICPTCGRPFTWRKKWQNCWDEVKYCSERCRRHRHRSDSTQPSSFTNMGTQLSTAIQLFTSNRRVWRWLGILLGIVGWLVINSHPALAVDVVPPAATEELTAPASTNPTASDISSEKVSQFIQCYTQVLALVEQREPIVNGAETELEAKQLEREVEAEALKIIEQAGLTLPEYFQLLGLANTDTEFSERIAAQLQEVD
jgi:hypothetical protein